MTLQKAITILMENTHLEMIVKSNLLGNNHKVDITEGASAQLWAIWAGQGSKGKNFQL